MRNRIPAFLLGFLATTSLSAAITGTVMTSDGQPIAGAKVTITAPEPLEAHRARWMAKSDQAPLAAVQTDTKGTYRFESPKEPPTLQLRIEARGYAPSGVLVERDGEVGAIPLRKADLKTGTITANGKPVAGAVVIWNGSTDAVSITDAEGKYSVADPSKWASRVTIVHPDFVVLDESMQTPNDPMRTKLDRTLEQGAKITGRVLGIDGQTPVAKASLSMNGWPLATSADDGTFTIAHAPKKADSVIARSGNLYAARVGNGDLQLGKSSSLTGTFRDAKTRAPIAGAIVRLLRGGLRFGLTDLDSAVTDAKGNYSFVPIAPGSYTLMSAHPSYDLDPVNAAVTPGQNATRNFTATPLAHISGTVIDDEKRGIGAASIRIAEETAMRRMAMRMIPPMQSYSAPDGRFILRTSIERLDVKARKKGLPEGSSGSVEVAAGERKTGVVITIPRGLEVSGRIVDRDGKPLSGVSVGASESRNEPGGGFRRMVMNMRPGDDDDVVRSSSDGTFSLRLKEGTYDLAFDREGFAAKRVRGHHVVSGAKPLEVTLEPGVEITGRVVRGGVGVEGVNIFMPMGDRADSTRTGPDGTFRLGDLTPGSVMVNFMKQEEFIQEIRSLNAPARDVLVELPRGGRVTGRVFDKATRQPVKTFQAGISATRSGGGMTMMMPPLLRSVTSSDGTFTLENVPAGPLQLVVTAPGYTTSRISSLSLEEGGTLENVEVALETGTRVTGKVTNASGSPVSGALVGADPFGGSRRGPRMTDPGANATTDENGEYALEAVEPGETTLAASHNSYLRATKTVNITGREQRVDFQLTTGLRITGQVVTESGVPVADADVMANSAAGAGDRARTDAGGTFSLENLSPGRYNFTARKTGYAAATLDDYDVSGNSTVRLTLKSGGTIFGHVSGLSESELADASVDVRGEGGGQSVAVDSAGNFRAEGAPIGSVRVSASVRRGISERRTSSTKTVQVGAGSSQEVNLEFASDTVVRGRITRNGQPAANVTVQFSPRDVAATTTASGATDERGNYAINGLEDGKYRVTVVDMQRMTPYTTTYELRGSGTFDIDMRVSQVRGRIIDRQTSEPLGDARIQMRPALGAEGTYTSRSVTSDSNGVFLLDGIPAGRYTVIGDKEGYGNDVAEISVSDTSADTVELKLARERGFTLKVVDARDGRLLSARVVVRDLQGRVIDDNGYRYQATPAPVQLSVSPGQYRATINAQGYATHSVEIVAPGELTVGLTPGGTLVIRSTRSVSHMARLIDARTGAAYIPMSYSRSPEFRLDAAPATIKLDDIVAGTYTLQLLGENNSVIDTRQVTVVDGQTATVDM